MKYELKFFYISSENKFFKFDIINTNFFKLKSVSLYINNSNFMTEIRNIKKTYNQFYTFSLYNERKKHKFLKNLKKIFQQITIKKCVKIPKKHTLDRFCDKKGIYFNERKTEK
ncbi:hypothetical protein BpHYR1_001811 [Brachionus plicatilis]|uniref:Uncharacterized protein n=1 Tax=Brachionus plicatilis TaxID=10195 RepID=A0A3M7S893_BRAPC|nr:hypothetical protein BpHYR1_001811 [Brachionus plicatilis]